MSAEVPVEMSSGILTLHMVQHIVAMNAVAPVLAFVLRRVMPTALSRHWVAAMVVQLVLLWAWHAPPVFVGAMQNGLLMAAMHASLFVAAMWFWSAILSIADDRRWQALFALLVTGKLFCLLAALLVFSRYPLFADAMAETSGAHPALMADQQLGGLLMLAACPATYLVAAVIIAARWLSDIEKKSSISGVTGA